ncbi:hypothetical protein KIPB_016052, partial [Kipferlia bialata]|eukprot:g16052.t1
MTHNLRGVTILSFSAVRLCVGHRPYHTSNARRRPQ